MRPPGNNPILSGGGFHHVAIKVKDYDAALAFYQALGCVPKTSWGAGDDRGALLDTGDGNYIEIFAGGDGGLRPKWGEGAALTHVCFRSTNVDACIAAARAAGATITAEPFNHTIPAHEGRQIQIRIAFCQSPSGEVIEFFDSSKL